MKYCDACQSTYPAEFTTCPKDQSPLRQTSELLPGMIIRDKYEILEKIGVGGMATVYKAKHLTFNEIRAIKVVSNQLMEDREFLRRFKTEAIISRKLIHANAVRLDDFDTTADGRPFIVMEFVQGRNLRSWLRDAGMVPVQRALNIGKQVASALGAAHKLGIVHRDIKPDNILIMPQPLQAEGGPDFVKVFDFGIAKIRDGAAEVAPGHAATQAGMVVGTPQYVSPEQASGKIGHQIDGRSDLYSLGVVIYEMVTGQLPFTSDTPVGFLIHHIQTAPRPPKTLNPALPDSVSAILMKALEKDREKRFRTAEEMLAALARPEAFAPPAPASTATQFVAATAPKSAAAAAGNRVPARGAISRESTAPVDLAPPARPGNEWDETIKILVNEEVLPRKKLIITAALILVILFASGSIWKRVHANRSVVVVNSPEEDARILQDVKQTLSNADELKREKVNAQVRNGVVTLSGRVSKSYRSEIAGSLVKDVDGVTAVTNDIEVVEALEQREQVWRSQRNNTGQAAFPRQQISPVDRQQVNTLIGQGYKRIAQRNFTAAEQSFQRALDLDPTSQAARDGISRARAAKSSR